MIYAKSHQGSTFIAVSPVLSRHYRGDKLIIATATAPEQRAWLWLLEIAARMYTELGRHLYCVCLYKDEENDLELVYASNDENFAMELFDKYPLAGERKLFLVGTNGRFEQRFAKFESMKRQTTG